MNTSTRTVVRVGGLLCMIALAATVAVAQTTPSVGTCSFKDLPPIEGWFPFPNGINDAGAVVGMLTFRHDPNSPAFLLYKGKYTQFNFPGSANTAANDISRFSRIVGAFALPINGIFTGHAFTVHAGSFQRFDFPGGTSTNANAVNSAGAIVGSYVDAANNSHAFLFYKGRFVGFTFPGAQWAAATGINDQSVIAGTYGDGTHSHGFQVRNGKFMKIDVPGASDTNVNKVNNAGDMVGSYTVDNMSHAFLMTGGKFFTIDHPNGTFGTNLGAINNYKQIVGTAFTGNDPTLQIPEAFVADCSKVH